MNERRKDMPDGGRITRPDERKERRVDENKYIGKNN